MNIQPVDKETTLGMSVDLLVSMMNHDCNPNAHICFEQGQLRVRSLRKIRAGDEVVVSYVDPRLHVLRRRESLKQAHYIDCNCT